VRALKPEAATSSTLDARPKHLDSRSGWWVALGVAVSLVAAYVLIGLGDNSLALGAGAICATIALAWGVPFSAAARAASRPTDRPGRESPAAGLANDRDPALYLDLEAVEVAAVYVLGAEVFTQLKGGNGNLVDPLTGSERHIETSDVSLTWRCQGRRSAAKLADRLNEWEMKGSRLRLLAARGRSALLMEDDEHWLALPELRLGG
jgi:hypothetical protein